MKKEVLVDTAAWLALVDKSDRTHNKAKEIHNDLSSIVSGAFLMIRQERRALGAVNGDIRVR